MSRKKNSRDFILTFQVDSNFVILIEVGIATKKIKLRLMILK